MSLDRDGWRNYEEYPVYFPAGDEHLFGVVCAPTRDGRDLGVVLLMGVNYTHLHRNRMWVRTARSLAELGFPSIRLDYHGVGDSTGESTEVALEEPYTEDALGAADFLRRATGVPAMVVVATCFGGRTALPAAVSHDDIVGAVVFPLPVTLPPEKARPHFRRRVKKALKRSAGGRWLVRLGRHRKVRAAHSPISGSTQAVSPAFRASVMAFLRKGGRLRFIYGDQTDILPDIELCLRQVMPRLNIDEQSRVHLDIVEGTELRGFHSLVDQDVVVQRAVAAVEAVYADAGELPANISHPGQG